MAVSMQTWGDATPLEQMQVIYSATYKMVMGGDHPPVPTGRWNNINWLSAATEELLDEHLEVAEDLSNVLDKLDQDETCHNAMSQVHILVRQGD